MFRWKLLFSLTCAIAVVFALSRTWETSCSECEGREGTEKSGEEKGEFPAEWFMQQRMWPDRTIPMESYRAAANTAARISARQTLDDQPNWLPVGPANIGGRVADIVTHPQNSQLFYIAAASGGIFKTTNGGGTWQPIFDQAPGQSMGALAMDAEHPDTLYAGTGEACSSGYSYFGTGIYRTTDAGASWANVGLFDSRYISRIVIDPNNYQSVWVAAMGELYVPNTERGIFHSTDAGMTWQRVLYVNDSTGASDVVIDPTNSLNIYAAMWQHMRTPHTRVAGGRGSGVFRSTDGGQTWNRLLDGLPAVGDSVGRIGIAISQSNPNILYAIYADHPGNFAGIFRTTDGGDTWGRTNDGSIADLFSNFGWYFGNIRVRPDNPNMVFALGVNLARSTNGGQSWNYVGNTHVDHHAMWFSAQQPNIIYDGNDGGAYRSTDNGNNWTFYSGLPINQFYAAAVDDQNPNSLIGGTQDNGTLYTQNGGAASWTHVLGGDGFYGLIDPTNSSVLYAEWQYGNLNRSTDGGVNFDYLVAGIDQAERRNWSTPVAMAPNNPSTLYYGGQHVFRSTNRGDTWSSFSPDLTSGPGQGNVIFGTITTIGVSSVDPNVIYAGTDDAHVWVKPGSGSAWINHSAGLPQRCVTRVVPDPTDVAVVYVTVSGFMNADENAHIFRSTDYGAAWLNISGDLPEGPLNDVIPDPEVPGRLYAASDFGAYVTMDLGGHWFALGQQLPRVPVIDLVLHNPSRTLIAATYGRSMFTLDLTQLHLGVSRDGSAMATSALLVAAYPNPFNSSTAIQYNIPAPGMAELSVYNILGQHAATLLHGPLASGPGRVTWSAQELPSGTYFLCLEAAGQTRIEKLLLIR